MRKIGNKDFHKSEFRNFRNALSILAESQAGNFLYPAASMPIW